MESPVNVQVTLPGCRPKSRVELVVVSRRIDVLISPHPLAILLRASSMIGTSIPLGSLGLKVPTGARIERGGARSTGPYRIARLSANFLDGILYTVRPSAVHKSVTAGRSTHACAYHMACADEPNARRTSLLYFRFRFVWRPRSILCLLGWIWQTIQASPRSYDQMSPLGGLPRCSTFRMRA